MKAIPVAALVLGAVERQVSLHQHGVRAGIAGNIRTDPDTDRDVDFVAVDKKGTCQRGLDLRGHDAGIRGLAHLRLQYRGLIPSQPCDHVTFSRAALQTSGDLLPQPITDRVAKRVIARFEFIQVEIKNCKPESAALGGSECHTEPPGESRAVCQARETIRAGEQGDFLLCRLALGDVYDDSFNLDEAPFLVPHGYVAVLDPM